MGNYVSCNLAGAHARSVEVVLPCGEVRRIGGPTNAAELMLDATGHFVVNSRSMHVGRRFVPLAADEDLEMGDVYVLVPMKRVNTAIAAADMAALLMAARKEVGGREFGGWRRGARVLPEAPAQVSSEMAELLVPKLELEDVTGASEAAESGELRYRLSMCRSKRPTLETIAEEGVEI